MAKKKNQKKTPKSKVRPLLSRPGAQYTCFGDGLCCTDIHGLGPITKPELVQLRKLDKEAGGYSEDFEDYMLGTAADGGCTFLMPDQKCAVHAQFGPEHKPDGCRRFPLGLVATPGGGRITTEHRCPCRTLGKRPDLDVDEVAQSLVDRGGRIYADRRIGRLKLDKSKPISFSQWVEIETELLAQLERGVAPSAVIDAQPFPEISGNTWKNLAEEFIEAKDGTQFGVAIAWFGEAIRWLTQGKTPRPPGRPWTDAFDRAERRSPKRTAAELFSDWIADEIWSLKWSEHAHFARARADLATRLEIAEAITQHLVGLSVREDRAAAEALLIVEVVGDSDHWTDVRSNMKVKKTRALN